MLMPLEGHVAKSNIEDVAIFWDGENKIENHIRRINLDSTGDSVAFIVPLPTMPEVYEVKVDIFKDFTLHLKPPVIRKTVWTPSALPFYGVNKDTELLKSDSLVQGVNSFGGAPRSKGLKLLQDIKVAGFSVRTLTADDFDSLEQWLDRNDFPLESNHKDYLEFYVNKKWTFSVFQFTKSNTKKDVELKTKTIGLKFKTSKPFHPYREPVNKRDEERHFKIFYFSKHKARIDFENEDGWDGKILIAKSLRPPVEKIPELGGDYTWMSVFEDKTINRKDSPDIYFSDAENDNPENHFPPVFVTKNKYLYVDVPIWLMILFIRRKKFKKNSLLHNILSLPVTYILAVVLVLVLKTVVSS